MSTPGALRAAAEIVGAAFSENMLVPAFAEIIDRETGVKELAEALDWCLQQFQGDSGTGETYWEDKPEYIKATAALAKHKGERA